VKIIAMNSVLALFFVIAVVDCKSAVDTDKEIDLLLEDILDNIASKHGTTRQQLELETQMETGPELFGIAVLNNKVYSANVGDKIKVFDAGNGYSALPDLHVDGMKKPLDMVADPTNNRLLVLEKHPYNWIWAVDPDSGAARKLIETSALDAGFSMSVAPSSGKLVVSSKSFNKLYVYDLTSGQRQDDVQLPDWMSPNNAVLAPNGNYIIAHVARRGKRNHDGVSEVDPNGQVLKTYDGPRGSGSRDLNKPMSVWLRPESGAVVVADFSNRRVVQLDLVSDQSQKQDLRVLVPSDALTRSSKQTNAGEDGNPSGRPWRVVINKSHLYVGISAGKIKVFKL
jgi:DNA-binding beta-propeller fold protein YncE